MTAESAAGDILTIGRRREPFATTPHWILCAGLSPQAQALYTILRAHVAEGGGSVAFPGQQALADLLGFNRRQSVIRYLRELESAGAITITRRVIGRARRNVYEIHETPPPDYTGPRTLAQFYERRRAQASSPETTPVREQTTTTNREPVGEPNREPIPEYIPEPIQDQSSEGTMCAPAHQGMCAPAHEGWCATAHKNKNKGTRTRELENYTSRGGSRTRERARPSTFPAATNTSTADTSPDTSSPQPQRQRNTPANHSAAESPTSSRGCSKTHPTSPPRCSRPRWRRCCGEGSLTTTTSRGSSPTSHRAGTPRRARSTRSATRSGTSPAPRR